MKTLRYSIFRTADGDEEVVLHSDSEDILYALEMPDGVNGEMELLSAGQMAMTLSKETHKIGIQVWGNESNPNDAKKIINFLARK